VLLGKPFAELGEIPSGEFGAALRLMTSEDVPIRRRDSPSGLAFYQRRPVHKTLMVTAYDGVRREFEVTAYPLFGTTGEMHGVVTVFWGARPGTARSSGGSQRDHQR
jgi:hypothetical protein